MRSSHLWLVFYFYWIADLASSILAHVLFLSIDSSSPLPSCHPHLRLSCPTVPALSSPSLLLHPSSLIRQNVEEIDWLFKSGTCWHLLIYKDTKQA